MINETSNEFKMTALHHLMSWNYSFALATGKAEHGTIQDFWDYVLDDYRNDKIPEPRYLKVHGSESEMSYARLTSLERENDHGTDTRTANQSVTQPIRDGVDIAVTGRGRPDRVDGEHAADSSQSEQRWAGDRDCG